MTDKIKLVELFAGIGSQSMALRNLGLDFETVAICEIDKFAYKSYIALHGDTPNLGDISQVDVLPDCNLLTYSFPCQDLSVAGLMKGMDKESGTRSSLLWEVGRLLRQYVDSDRALPKILLMENVDAILNRRNIRQFEDWIADLTNLGYTSSYQILNAKDYGIPQSRNRCFMVSVLGNESFRFPEPVPLELRLKDVLESDPDPSYTLSEKALKGMIRRKERGTVNGNKFGFKITDDNGIARAITTKPPQNTDTLLMAAKLNGNFIQRTRVYNPEGLSPTLCNMGGGGDRAPRITCKDSVRCLTPRESWRLMGFTDADYDRAAEVCSKTQLYKQAGNSIVVPVLEAIFRGIYIDKTFTQQHKVTDYQ